MDDYSDAQIQLINYFEKAIEAQPRWIQRMFEKEKVVFIISGDDHIGLKFTNKVCPEDKAIISDYFKKYVEQFPCEISKGATKEVIN